MDADNAVPAGLTRGYSNSFMDTMLSRAAQCQTRPDPRVPTQAELDELDAAA